MVSKKIRKSSGNRKHIAPITLNYRLGQSGEYLSGTTAAFSTVIDLAQGLSIVGRKLYRQGKCYYVSAISLVQQYNATDAALANSTVEVQTIPNTWETANAWSMAFGAWNKMRKEVLDNQPSLKARWADFKILFNGSHYTALASGGYNNPLPQLSVSGSYNPFTYDSSGSTVGEWDYSEFTLPDHTLGGTAIDFFGHMMGPDDGGPIGTNTLNSAGLLRAYEEARVKVQPKDADAGAATGMYSNLFDLGGQQVDLTDDIVAEGAFPPYDQNLMGNVASTDAGYGITQLCLQTNQGLPIASSVTGFPVPCGMLFVKVTNTSGSTGTDFPTNLLVTMTPGKYNGVHAETMGQ